MNPRKKAPATPEEAELDVILNLAHYRVCPCCGGTAELSEAMGKTQGKARRRYHADELRAVIRRAEDGADFGPWAGEDTLAYFETLLGENARHEAFLNARLEQVGYRWNGERVVRLEGGGGKGEGAKRTLLRLDVERVLRRLNVEDGLPPGTKRNNRAIRDRIRADLAWTRDPSDLTDERLKATLKNIGDWGMAGKAPGYPPPAKRPRKAPG
ncbi:MAG TPA: hypothetical protein VLH75_09360 [Longimicrobiales bacterium]|nr:hypothetical protein [Longimicrobiales bacterium]